MPSFDLKDQSGGLHPLALFKVLAVMCQPTDRKMRERMLAPVQRETGAQAPSVAIPTFVSHD